MTVYETLALMFQAGILLVALLMYVETKNHKK